MLLQEHKPLVNLLTKNDKDKIIGLAVRHFKEEKAGLVTNIYQFGLNFRVVIEWENQSTSEEWITCLISLQPKVLNIDKFLIQKGILKIYQVKNRSLKDETK